VGRGEREKGIAESLARRLSYKRESERWRRVSPHKLGRDDGVTGSSDNTIYFLRREEQRGAKTRNSAAAERGGRGEGPKNGPSLEGGRQEKSNPSS